MASPTCRTENPAWQRPTAQPGQCPWTQSCCQVIHSCASGHSGAQAAPNSSHASYFAYESAAGAALAGQPLLLHLASRGADSRWVSWDLHPRGRVLGGHCGQDASCSAPVWLLGLLGMRRQGFQREQTEGTRGWREREREREKWPSRPVHFFIQPPNHNPRMTRAAPIGPALQVPQEAPRSALRVQPGERCGGW